MDHGENRIEFLDEHRKPKEKDREKCCQDYQNRCMDGSEEHAK